MKRYIIYILLCLPMLGMAQFGGGGLIVDTDCSDVSPNATRWYRDADGDGYHGLQSLCAVSRPNGYIAYGISDCNDNSYSIKGLVFWYRDADGDGYGISSDRKKHCSKPSGYVNNAVDCNDSNASIGGAITWYRDADGDGYGNTSVRTTNCFQPSGYVNNNSDRNDSNNLITNIAPRNFYRDADGDGFGNPSVKTYRSVRPSGYVTNASDCNDSNASLNINKTWYRDADSDGYGNSGVTKSSCSQPLGYVINKLDCKDNDASIHPNTVWYRDADGDSYGTTSSTKTGCYTSLLGYVTRSGDCNDSSASLHPNTVWYRDADGDGYGNASITKRQCSRPGGYVSNDDDYNDGNNLITNIAPRTFYRDADNDSFGTPNTTTYRSVRPSGYVTVNTDCNDSDASINPHTFWYRDFDGDGFGDAQTLPKKQCTRPSGHVLNDDDLDDSTNLITTITPRHFYRDADGDGYGNPANSTYRSVQPSGYVANQSDCNDTNNSLHPNTVWYQDGDGDGWGNVSVTKRQCVQPSGYVRNDDDYNDTNILITNVSPRTFYADADGDSYGNPSVSTYRSVQPTGYVTVNTDCNDSDASINPTTIWYRDADSDGWGNSSVTKIQCSQPSGYVRNDDDYNDANNLITNIAPRTFYRDADGDTFGNPSTSTYRSVQPTGYASNNTDCNDTDASIHPNTLWYADTDGDGWGSPTVTRAQCTQPVGYIENNQDLDDTNELITNLSPVTFYRDADMDGYGESATTVQASFAPAGYVSNAADQCPDQTGNYKGCITLPYTDVSLSANENYVFTRAFQTPVTTSDAVKYDADVIESVTYFDGLGRPKQQIGIKGSGYSSTRHIDNELTRDWNEGVGSTGFFNQNGTSDENQRAQKITPDGYLDLVWVCGNDEESNADGGWNTDYFDVDKNVGYRYTVWVKRTGSQNGSTYHGTQRVNNLNGGANGNPYFWSGDVPQLDTWYLLVGVIHPYQYTGGNMGVSGVYDIDGNKVIDGRDFRWMENTTTSRFRSYLYYSTDINTKQYFWNPVVQKLDGSETSLPSFFEDLNRAPKDIITHLSYDAYGRQSKEYLPYATKTNAGAYQTTDVVNDINRYYLNKYPADFTGITDPVNVNAYSETIFEPSPLNRPLKQGAPGKDWKADTTNTDHTIKIDRRINTTADAVVYFKVDFDTDNTETPSLVKVANYAENNLFVSITKDENWVVADGKNHTTEEYTDKLGRVVLKRTFASTSSANAEPHDTYYVYDDFGNLTYVIPPKVDVTNGISDIELAELCYQYRYDYRNRLVEKKIPGKGDANTFESIVYNRLDQPVLTQDPNQKAIGAWLFTKYDVLGRVAYTGTITIPNKTRGQIQTEVNSFSSNLWVTRGSEVMIGGTTLYYNNDGYPNAQNAEVLTINYYDDYSFLGNTPSDSFMNPIRVYDQDVDERTKSLSTGSKVKVLSTSYWITSVSYYDKKSRPIYVVSENEYLNTIDIGESKLDFVGKVEETKTTHIKGSNAAIVTIDTFEYDHMGRLLKQEQAMNGQQETIAENNYDELGQLTSKTVGDGLQQVDYTYNVRGWLSQINEPNNMGNDLFAFGINYNTTTENLGAIALYNGNISETLWKSANDNTKRAYGYQYDALNRITAGTSSDGRYNLSGVSYDKNGNIKMLNRLGAIVENPDQTRSSDFGTMDNLVYEYDQGNKLLKVNDQVVMPFGFTKNATVAGDHYQYDINGNMISDTNKGISTIAYNHFNLPENVVINNTEHTGNISYIYDATGTKLKKIVTEGSSLTTTEYAGNYVYENGQLKFFNTPEGYIEPNGSGSFDYVYQLKDISDNIRITYSDGDGDGKIDLVRNNIDIDGDGDLAHEIRKEQNFYPFGLEHKGYNTTLRGVKNNLKTYQGQEFTEDLGLNTHEWRYRVSDPAIGRFWQIDPLAEDYTYNSTYAFQENKLGMGIELEGLEMVPRNSAAIHEAKLKKANRLEKEGKTSEAVSLRNEANTVAKVNTTIFSLALAYATGGRQGLVEEGIEAITGIPIIPDPTDLIQKTGKLIFQKGAKFANEGEKKIADLLSSEGKLVEVVAESTETGVKSADFLIDGVKTELKTISNITSKDLSNALKKRILSGTGQSGNIIIDVSAQSGATRDVVQQALNRAFGASKNLKSVRVVGDGFDFVKSAQ